MASRYVVPAGGNWNSTATWSASDGGAGGASVPSASDDVFLTSLSGNLVVNTTATCATFDCAGYTGTLSGGSTLTIAGSSGGVFRLSAGMAYTRSASTSFTGTGGTILVTSAGKTLGTVTINGAGLTVQLQDDFASSVFTLTAGTFDANDHDVTIVSFSSSNSTARGLLMGNGTWTITAAGTTTIWNTGTTTNLTFDKEGAALVVEAAAAGSYTFSFGSLSFNDLTFLPAAPAGRSISISSALSVAALSLGGTLCIDLAASITATSLVIDSGPDDFVSIINRSPTTTRSISIASGTVEADHLVLCGVTGTGGATFMAGRHSIDLGSNPGWTFASTVTHQVDGTTKDNAGASLAGCDVYLLKETGDAFDFVSHAVSDGSGDYALDAFDDDPTHVVVSFKPGTPNVMDVSDFVTPAAA